MLLNEIFNYKVGTVLLQNGKKRQFAYIDKDTSEDTYKYKDVYPKYGAVYYGALKAWGWWLDDNDPQSTIENEVKPCIEYLTSIEQNDTNPARDAVAIIDQLIEDLKNDDGTIIGGAGFTNQVMERLESFKQELIKTTSSEEFKQMMEPIIKFRNARGHSLSFTNAILVYIQDPKATMVKSASNWAQANREVLPNAPKLMIRRPNMVPYTAAEKKKKKQEYLNKIGVSSEAELTIGQKEKLKVLLSGKEVKGYGNAFVYDVRYTRQMDGKEDLIGNNGSDIQWYDDSGEETPETIRLIEKLINIIKKEGIKVEYVDDIGGARGVSKSGSIDILANQPRNIGMLSTLIHEFSHEMLHQSYLSKKGSEISQYFIGTKQGRAIVEQQAELCAWIVLKSLGYDDPTAINYVGMWGLNENNAVEVFDTVAAAANNIVDKLNKPEKEMQTESKKYRLNETITGLDIAKMVGAEKLYIRGKKNVKTTDVPNMDTIVSEAVDRSLRNLLKGRK